MLVNLVPSAMDFATRPKRVEPQKKSVPIVPDAIDPVTRTTISLEYASLQHRDHCPLGMYVVPSPESLLVWDAVFFVHQGYYADAILKFRLTFPSNYPDSPPTVQFVTDVFHPLISQSGMFNLAPRFRPWRPKEHRVFDVLHWTKAAFKKQALDGIRESECLNKEAYRLCAGFFCL
ncbi:ubiquitin-conjugating enzyme/RWD-like protein [Mycena sanguinolenta]|nr:ubiquitin-conjugating enzyme/RWD-like protein [Mycena sanguinolenta]